jgi:mRNA-degrading endonuclease toxin of MazEF toxin-antitoxin module
VEELRYGDIVRAWVRDPNDQNLKLRPILIISPNSDIEVRRHVNAVGISSSNFPPVIPPDWFDLPWDENVDPKTGLNRRSVAKCDWRLTVPKTEIEEKMGRAPNRVMRQIAEYFANL